MLCLSFTAFRPGPRAGARAPEHFRIRSEAELKSALRWIARTTLSSQNSDQEENFVRALEERLFAEADARALREMLHDDPELATRLGLGEPAQAVSFRRALDFEWKFSA